jgi:O-antigen/teichoic acid export membrane protein
MSGNHKRLLLNTVANAGGQLLGPMVALILVPVYLSVLGRDAYGLIGFFSAISLLLGVFSQGVGQALQREIARREALEQERPTIPRLVRTFERVYGSLGLFLALILIAVSGPISRDWLQQSSLEVSTMRTCLILLALRIGIAFPSGVYLSVFIGTQRQVIGNATNMVSTLLGTLLIVGTVFATRSVAAVIATEMLTHGLTMLALRWQASRLLRAIAPGATAGWSGPDLKAVARPSAWIIWSSGIGVFVTQCDPPAAQPPGHARGPGRVQRGRWRPDG